MPNDKLASFGVSLCNIGAAIAERLDSDVPAHEVLDEILNREFYGLTTDGQPAVANSIQTMRGFRRILTEGW